MFATTLDKLNNIANAIISYGALAFLLALAVGIAYLPKPNTPSVATTP